MGRSTLTELFDRVRTYIAGDVEEGDLSTRLSAAEAGDAAALADLQDRFQGPLQFGTAGLRGLMGLGEHRMNRATVLRATDGLVRYLIDTVPGARDRGLVVGRDGRNRSEEFQKDVAAVAVAHGMRVYWLPEPSPTPLAAFGVTHLGAAAGVVVTASHNPPAYNGYKVFWTNGAQIIPPHDTGIAAAIATAPVAKDVPWDEFRVGDKLVVSVASLVETYLDALDSLHFAPAVDLAGLRIAYSSLHGVGAYLFERALLRRGDVALVSVPEQAEPNGDFPTVAFPNPEEPGALDLVMALAERERCDLVLVHDPDADRLGAAVRVGERFQVLSGNEIGILLGDHILSHTDGDDRLVVSTLVSSRQLARMAADRGVRFAETLTGFKWIANEGLRLEAQERRRFVFGYEEALGYCCGTVVRDKDGIGAGLVLAEMAAEYRAKGQTLVDALTEIRRRHGVYVSDSKSVTFANEPQRIRDAMTRLRSRPLEVFRPLGVKARHDLSTSEDPRRRGNVLIFELEDGGRIAVRPSGTEPKIKLYLDIVEEGEVDSALVEGRAKLDRLLEGIKDRGRAVAELSGERRRIGQWPASSGSVSAAILKLFQPGTDKRSRALALQQLKGLLRELIRLGQDGSAGLLKNLSLGQRCRFGREVGVDDP